MTTILINNKSSITNAIDNSNNPDMKKNPKQQTNIDGEGIAKTDPTEIFRGFAGTTSRVVHQAASILEEEIAAGIVAAKQVEDRLINSSKVSSGKSNTLMQRFRKDFHEVVDIVLDLIDAAVDYANAPNQLAVTMQGVTQEENTSHKNNGQLPTLMMPVCVNAGESVEAVMKLENNIDEPTGEFGFQSTDLVSSSGDRISARQVRFTPSSVTMEPHNTKEFTIAVNIPKRKPVGTYSGLIQTTQMDQLQAVLVVQVGQIE